MAKNKIDLSGSDFAQVPVEFHYSIPNGMELKDWEKRYLHEFAVRYIGSRIQEGEGEPRVFACILLRGTGEEPNNVTIVGTWQIRKVQ
jgi:hypothetical protein